MAKAPIDDVYSPEVTGRVFYRADTRSPDEIFRDGFSPRDPASIAPKLRGGNGGMAPDLEPASGVCMTSNWQSAAMFPVGKRNQNGYIYAVHFTEAELASARASGNFLDTEAEQMKHIVAAGVKTATYDQALKQAWPLFGYESAITRIPSENIACAIPIARTAGKDRFQVNYTLGDRIENPQFTQDPQARREVEAQLDMISHAAPRGTVQTTIPMNHGLGGKTFGSVGTPDPEGLEKIRRLREEVALRKAEVRGEIPPAKLARREESSPGASRADRVVASLTTGASAGSAASVSP
jgi:hypothetical protein